MTTIQAPDAPLQHVVTDRPLTAMLFRRLMPLLIFAYVISFLDRTNIALAKSHIAVDLHISSAAYGLGAGLFFLTYALFEVPSNLIMHRVGARFWITRIMITWGLLSAGMAFINGQTAFYVMRLLLGVAEAGLFPGVLLYLTYWFGREERARATGYFLLGVCIANILGGPLGGALLQMDGVGGLHGWQWMFLLEGLPAVVLAFVVWKKLPDGPADAPWLTRPQADEIRSRLAAECAQGQADGAAHSFFGAIRDRQIWLAIFVYFCHQIAIYTVIFFLPGIIGTWGQALAAADRYAQFAAVDCRCHRRSSAPAFRYHAPTESRSAGGWSCRNGGRTPHRRVRDACRWPSWLQSDSPDVLCGPVGRVPVSVCFRLFRAKRPGRRPGSTDQYLRSGRWIHWPIGDGSDRTEHRQ